MDPTDRVRVIGYARYDGDRGGAQEDDRVGGNERRLREILAYSEDEDLRLNRLFCPLFLNDGPGLTLGSMWADYSTIEEGGQGQALGAGTLKMAQAGRVSLAWLASYRPNAQNARRGRTPLALLRLAAQRHLQSPESSSPSRPRVRSHS